MNVLFVSSGNSKAGISPIIKNQADSLVKQGVNIDFYTIKGKGIKGYFSHIFLLKRYLKDKKYDVIHAHYSFSGITAALAGAKPLIVSLMGSDIESSFLWKIVIRIFYLFFWKIVIVKSKGMKDKLGVKNVKILPNGVDLKKFTYIDKEKAKKIVNFNDKRHILFLSDPKRKEKNYDLAEKSFKKANLDNAELNVIYNVSNELIPYYLYASDVLILTSLWEGSPNVIKEAMACNLPIVTTNVGDVKKIIGNTEGCFITDFSEDEISKKLALALDFGKETKGRDRIKELGIDSVSIANKLLVLYYSMINNN